MGSGNPKRSDRPIISSPLKSKGGGGSGSGGEGRDADINQVCVEAFDVPLKKDSLLKKGQTLTLSDKGDVLLFGRAVGKLTAGQFRRVGICEQAGYRYRGIVAQDKKQTLYGRFERYTA